MMERVRASLELWSRPQLRQAITDVRARATKLGRNPAKTVSRLTSASFVSRAHRYVYVETPKVACTGFKSMIVDLEGVRPDPSLRPYMREVRLDMLIHQRDYIALPSILDLTANERASIFDGDPAWFVFAVVRNPFSRLVSMFENKVRVFEPDFRFSAGQFKEGNQVDRVTLFRHFLHQVSINNNGIAENPHVAPQSGLLLTDLINYTKVFHIEALHEAMTALNAHIASCGHKGLVALPRRNAALRTEWRAYYDAESAAIVQRLYADDFRLFGYDPSDWHADNNGTVREETDAEQYWREQVIARNEMIDYLYDLLDARLGKTRHRRL